MSRIVGLAGVRQTDRRQRLASAMLQSLRISDRWTTDLVSAGTATLGWTGRRIPNTTRHGRIIAVADGFVYNSEELGAAAAPASYLLSTLAGRVGAAAALRQANADVAFALYDEQDDVLWVGVDRFRVKPLYYVKLREGVAFGSQPRALLTLAEVSRDPNRQFVGLFGASHYRTIDNDIEASPYAAIRQVPPGGLVEYRNDTIRVSRYWELTESGDSAASEAELAEQYRSLMIDAVRRRWSVATRPAFTLSGGMDSSSVMSTAVHATGSRHDALSIVYVDKTYDESDDIQSMLEPNVRQWHAITVETPDVFETVKKLVRVHDEPVATATWLSHYLLCEEAARLGYESLFGGLGADELNAGEYEHFWYFFADLRVGGQEVRLQREVGKWIEHHDHPVFRKTPELMEATLPRIADLRSPGRCLADRARIERYAATLNPDFFDLRRFEPVMDHPFLSYLKNRTYQDLIRETIPCCLRSEDRHMVAFGMENFLPFFDHRVVEFMYRVPGDLKYCDGVTKRLLREAMRGILPEETRTRPKKSGFNAPAHVWFAGAMREPLLDLVGSRAFRDRGIFNVPEVERLIHEHFTIVTARSTVDNHMMFFWQLVNLELWLQSIDEPRSDSENRSPMPDAH